MREIVRHTPLTPKPSVHIERIFFDEVDEFLGEKV